MVKVGGAVMFTDQGTRSFPRGEGPARERAEVKDGRLRAQPGGVGFPATVWPRGGRGGRVQPDGAGSAPCRGAGGTGNFRGAAICAHLFLKSRVEVMETLSLVIPEIKLHPFSDFVPPM